MNIIDSKAISSIDKWSGDRNDWKRFNFVLMSYIGRHSDDLRQHLESLAVEDRAIEQSSLAPEMQLFSAQLHYIFTMVTKDTALDTLMNCPIGNGLEFYRMSVRDCNPMSKGHQRGQLLALIDAREFVGIREYKQRLTKWEHSILEYDKRAEVDKEFSDELKMATYQAKIAPDDVRA